MTQRRKGPKNRLLALLKILNSSRKYATPFFQLVAVPHKHQICCICTVLTE
ncbi:hypothetical protein FDUTEX481_02617 [Tolypothrix sp. PCC 7601]|nr:hypothetical protein FDUTEX481_02617 [Tolypothrix sp. PCC 7601]